MSAPAASIDKALDVLFHLHAQPAARGVSEVGRALGLPKSSAHRLLGALASRGLLERDARGRYRPGIALVALGLGVLGREPVVEAAHPVLEAAAEESGETFFLAAARAGRLHVLDKAEGPGFLRAAPRVGATLPVHATAVGKLYLAFAPDALSDPGRERFTPQTLDAEGLARAVARARRDGWAANRDEWTPGLLAVAAPVRHAGRIRAAVAVAAPSAAVGRAALPELARRVVQAAGRIEARLGEPGAVAEGGA